MSAVHVVGDYFLYIVKKKKTTTTNSQLTVIWQLLYWEVFCLSNSEKFCTLPPAHYREYYAHWTFFRRTWRILEYWNSFKSSNLNYFLRANLGELTRSFDMQKYQQGGNVHARDKLNNDWLVRDQYFVHELGLWPNPSREGKVALILFNIYFELALS